MKTAATQDLIPSKYYQINSLIFTIRNDNRPYAEVYVGKKKLIGLLDSGADVTVLGKNAEKLIEELNLQKYEVNASVRTADGTKHNVSTYVKIPFTYDAHTHTISTLVIPTLSKQLILGMDFWRVFRIELFVGDECDFTMNEIERIAKTSPVEIPHDLTPDQTQELQKVKAKFLFTQPGILSCTPLIEHNIDTGEAKPIRVRQRPTSPFIQQGIYEEIDRMLSLGIIGRTTNPTWLNPIVPVRKTNGKIRLTLDARYLNSVTVKTKYPPQDINRILSRLQGTVYLTAIDLTDAYYQIRLTKKASDKCAFAISTKGTFHFLRMPNGACNSAGTLCEFLDNLFNGELEPDAFHFHDDFIICTETFEQHLLVLGKVAERLEKARFTISESKSKFVMKRVRFLGYVLDESGLQADPERIRPLLEYAQPKCVKDVRRLIGLAGWYRRFIDNFSAITAPITELTKKSTQKFEWTTAANESFEKLKAALTTAPILAMPDYSKPFVIQCDSSLEGIGCVLIQGEGENERVIAYMSQKLTPAQRNWHTTERECYAVLAGVMKFRNYVEAGPTFTVITDHASLTWLRNLKDPTGRLARWALQLQSFDYILKHRPGRELVVADALSRAVELIDVDLFAETTDNWYAETKRNAAISTEVNNVFKLSDGLLYKYCTYKNSPGWKIVVPSEHYTHVLRECHDDPLAAHGGTRKTSERVRKWYYWPNHTATIRQYVKMCEVCKACKASNVLQRPPMGQYREAKRPWRTISCDLMGPFVPSRTNHKWILVVTDSFSKFVVIDVLKNATTHEIVDVIDKRVFLTFGVCENIVCDNGSQFKSKLFKETMGFYGSKIWLTPGYHPQANATEAVNSVVITSIRAYVEDKFNHDLWDIYVEEIACAVNTSVHESSQHTPYFINFGREMATHGDQYRLVFDANANVSNASDNSARVTNMSDVFKEVQLNLRKAYERSKKQYDLHTRPIQYDVGEKVWLRNFKLSDAKKAYSAKLAPKFVPMYIADKVGSDTYLLEDPKGKPRGKFHAKDLKKD